MNSGFKCRLCKICDGRGCIGELPGMGGVFGNYNFIQNVSAWKKYYSKEAEHYPCPLLRLAPMTGAVQNAGWRDEKSFYPALIKGALNAGVLLSIGDGFPDEKLFLGLEALEKNGAHAAVFLKPYPQIKLFERAERSKTCAEIIGVDTDAYNIVTMRNQVNLERKKPSDLKALRNYTKLPLAVKGVFTSGCIELVKELKPEIIVISNHGGRVETERGSSADFLFNFGKELKRYCCEVWVDGGIRTKQDLLSASYLGAVQVLIGRPMITAIMRDEKNGIRKFVTSLTN